jgi:hypothetical protein
MAASTTQQYISLIRFYLNDYPETNVLLGEEESSDGKIMLAMLMTCDEFNTMDPTGSNYGIDSFPSLSLLVKGTIIHLLRSAGILHSRNSLNYTAGGLSVQIWSKAKDYITWIQTLQGEYLQMSSEFIKRINIAKAMKLQPYGLHSDFWLASFCTPGFAQ